MSAKAIDIREWFVYGSLWLDVSHGGILCMTGTNTLSTLYWNFANVCFLYGG